MLDGNATSIEPNSAEQLIEPNSAEQRMTSRRWSALLCIHNHLAIMSRILLCQSNIDWGPPGSLTKRACLSAKSLFDRVDNSNCLFSSIFSDLNLMLWATIDGTLCGQSGSQRPFCPVNFHLEIKNLPQIGERFVDGYYRNRLRVDMSSRGSNCAYTPLWLAAAYMQHLSPLISIPTQAHHAAKMLMSVCKSRTLLKTMTA